MRTLLQAGFTVALAALLQKSGLLQERRSRDRNLSSAGTMDLIGVAPAAHGKTVADGPCRGSLR